MPVLHEHVAVGPARSINQETGRGQCMVGLSFLKDHVDESTADYDDDENFDDYFVSVAAAKALVVELQEVIDQIVRGEAFPNESNN